MVSVVTGSASTATVDCSVEQSRGRTGRLLQYHEILHNHSIAGHSRETIQHVRTVVESVFNKSIHAHTKNSFSSLLKARFKYIKAVGLCSEANVPSILTFAAARVVRGGGEAGAGDEAIAGAKTHLKSTIRRGRETKVHLSGIMLYFAGFGS